MKTNDNNLIASKSFDFAVRCINLYKYLNNTAKVKEFVLSKQLLRSGTSIGANVEEAIGAHSKADFYAKITIAYKEARETHYWLRLLHRTGYINENEYTSIKNDIEEILKIIAKIQITTKNNS